MRTVKANTTNSIWDITKGDTAKILKENYRNGEHHMRGIWLTGKRKGQSFDDIPSVFFY